MENSDINHFLSDIPGPVSAYTARENYHFSIIIFSVGGEASPHPFPQPTAWTPAEYFNVLYTNRQWYIT